ncbi:hypothetical protein HBA55_29690 [Pseudomaricurvus alkylphenolicus]|uniref:hypothetical protein n=1 Tax=Pseudomaricurvus alkylphenolicus TaxID=1306991 RepID=UPI00141F00A4|nr:hypothetical protein [Pseudomaricurvus alkylphenolicus]NIB43812.1 hypothetical protein [Pseudomaricurvus alkylphenolicus]
MEPLTRSYSSGLLTTIGAETLHDTTEVINYEIDGKMYRKTAITNGVTPTSDGNGDAFTAIGADKIGVFVWALDASGAVAVFQGEIEDVDGDSDVAEIYPQFPALPAGYAPFGYTIIQTTGAASPFDFGTDNWNATGVTATTVNIGTIPSRPQNS